MPSPRKGVVSSINLLGSIDGLTFEAFVIRKLIPKLWKGAVVIWDNYSIHKGKEIEKAITKAGAKLIYLPPYSPDFNPIENCWSKIKSILRSIGAPNIPRFGFSDRARLILKYLSKTFATGLLMLATVSHQFENRYSSYFLVVSLTENQLITND